MQLLANKVTDWINDIGKSNLPPQYKKISFHTRLFPQVTYSLGVVMLKPSEYESFTTPMLRNVKSIFSLPISFPKALLNLDSCYGGYGILDCPLIGIAEK